MVKQKHLVLVLMLIAAALLLGGCGVGYDAVDVEATAPEGLWQSLVVWPLAKALIWLNGFLQGINLPYSWGFAIILFTVIIKIITFPLTMSQIKGMQAQKELQPRIQELQKKYGKDREKLSQEQMKLYKDAGVNPLSGCLPLIVQMPVLFGLYSALVVLGPRLIDARFFWIPDLAFPAFTGGLGWIPDLFTGGEYGRLIGYLVLPVLLMVSQVYMQKHMTPATPGSEGQAGMMKQMTTIMTLMFGFFTLQVPAGLTLYWVTSNFLQMAQQHFITKMTPTTAGAGSTPPVSPVKTMGGTTSTAAVATTNGSPNGAKGDAGSDDGVVEESQNRSKRSRRQRKKK
jgi:YidC/Oxa1 family membrane protein insertase